MIKICLLQIVAEEDTVNLNNSAEAAMLPEEASDMQQTDQPPSGDEATAVVSCQGCGRRYHRGCVQSHAQVDPVYLSYTLFILYDIITKNHSLKD